MEFEIYTTATLLGLLTFVNSDLEKSDYFLDLLYPSQVNFTTEEVRWSKLTDIRKIAPFVIPTQAGKPIFTEAERVESFRPAYIKLLDAIIPSDMIRKRAGQGNLVALAPETPMQRRNNALMEILRQHMTAIRRRWAWMAARAAIDGQVTVSGEGFPTTIVDFGRDPAHTITKAAGTRWGDVGVSILDDIQAWRQMMRVAKFGGVSGLRITMGAEVWDKVRKDPEIKDLLSTQFRLDTRNYSIDPGITGTEEVEYVGRVDGVDMYVYSGYFQDASGAIIHYLDPKDLVMTSNQFQGVRAFGAIHDLRAGLSSFDIFPTHQIENSGESESIQTASAPIFVPIQPNASLRATVVG